MDLKDNAAMFLEEMNISGDTMVDMNHNIEDLPEYEKGAYNLFDIMKAFVEHVRGEGLCHEAKATLPINSVTNQRELLINFCTFYFGDENSQLPEDVEKIIDIYLKN